MREQPVDYEQDSTQGYLTRIPLSELHDFPDHPFAVRDDDAMKETVESVKNYGVLVPAIVRPLEDGGYEIIAGHRRKRACELAGFDTLFSLVRKMDDDEATIIMVDSNLQRENILPSERAKAYKMKLEAIKHQGQKSQRTSSQLETRLRSDEVLAREAGESRAQIQRYIRLTELSPPLQQMVDDKKIAMTPAVELSYLKPREQALLIETIESEQTTPSLSQAQRMKKLSQIGQLNEDNMLDIMSEQKKPEREDITLSGETLRKYFPRSYTPRQMETVILRLLDAWMKKRQQEQSR
ncbi:MAG: ParB/RepB/Spo0J family partition protein [Oscillospiraceae bacterium]